MPGIEVHDVSFGYGRGNDVLSRLSLRAAPGQVLGLLGPNGAGKTTLLRLIAGLLRPRAGAIRVDDIELTRDRREASRRLGFAPDEPLLYPKLSALENMARFALLWEVPADAARARAEAWLRAIDLFDKRHQWVEGLSRGMRQRLALCCALLHCPKVLLLDEPFNGLDLQAALWLRKLLRERAMAGDCIVLSTHQPETLDAIADRLALIHAGRIVREVDRDELASEGGTAQLFLRTCGGPLPLSQGGHS
jgi:ABC-2 type transport system ATP-binding protein